MKFYILLLWVLLSTTGVWAQGPPITADKAIMLAKGNIVVKTLTEIRKTDLGTFTKAPIMVHYLPSSNFLLSVHLPLVSHHFKNKVGKLKNGFTLGDIELMVKYQFYRKDAMAKTLRMVFKTLQILPTGKKYAIDEISTGAYQSYFSWVTGYETIKYGISNEVGYKLSTGKLSDELIHKFGVGLPLLKPVYPVKQINLYFEYKSAWFVQARAYNLLYSQGIQYAIKQLTVEAAIQFPLIQSNISNEQIFSLILGTRYVF